jgi:hypothetical protein
LAKGAIDAIALLAGPPKLDKGKGESGGMADEYGGEGSAESRAGSRFGQAVKSGDGAAIARAFRQLREACDANEGSSLADSDSADEGDEGEG